MHGRVRARHTEVRRVYPAKLRYERGVAKRCAVSKSMQRRRVFRDVSAECDDVQRAGRSDVRCDRHLAGRRRMRESGVRERRLHGCMRTGDETVFEQRRPDVRRRRTVVRAGFVRDTSVRRWSMRGRMCSGDDTLLGERRRDMQHGRSVGRGVAVHGSGMPERRLHGRVHAEHEAMQRSYAANVRRERSLAEWGALPERVQRRCVFGVVQPERETM
jgi:hypothetical protein